jgi:hypothetical protein
VVPEAGRPQALNRYAYVYNNPVRYADPGGHMIDCGWGGGGCESQPPPPPHPLSEEIWLYAQQAAEEFGLPPEFVAAVLWAEQRYDYRWEDAIEDSLARAGLLLVEAQELSQQSLWARLPGGDFGSGDSYWQGWVILGVIEVFDSSLGVGQVKLSTARRVAEYASYELGLGETYAAALSTRALVSRLEDPGWNTRYVAGYLRRLADIRGTEEFTIQEMQILYGAYRTPLELGPLELSRPGPIGSLLSPEVIYYYRGLSR